MTTASKELVASEVLKLDEEGPLRLDGFLVEVQAPDVVHLLYPVVEVPVVSHRLQLVGSIHVELVERRKDLVAKKRVCHVRRNYALGDGLVRELDRRRAPHMLGHRFVPVYLHLL